MGRSGIGGGVRPILSIDFPLTSQRLLAGNSAWPRHDLDRIVASPCGLLGQATPVFDVQLLNSELQLCPNGCASKLNNHEVDDDH